MDSNVVQAMVAALVEALERLSSLEVSHTGFDQAGESAAAFLDAAEAAEEPANVPAA